MDRCFKCEKGSTFVALLIALVVLSLLGIALLSLSLSDTKHSIVQENNIQADYLARSGVDDIANYVINNNTLPIITIGTVQEFGNGRSFTLERLESFNSSGIEGFFIAGRGEADGQDSVLGLTITKYNPSDLLDHAVYSVMDLVITNLEVYGTVASGGDVDYDKKYNEALYGKPQEGVSLAKTFAQFPIVIPLLPYKVISTYTDDTKVDADYTYASINVTGNGDQIVFNTGSSDDVSVVVIENGFIGNQSKMIVTGEGLLQLYIKSFEAKGSIEIDSTAELEILVESNGVLDFQTPLTVSGGINPNSIRIYLDKDSTLKLQANGEYNMYVIGPEATISMQSADTVINGAIIGNVVMGNNNDKPNGVVNYIVPDDSWDLYIEGYRKSFYQSSGF